ncbi:MAG: Gfo/Idh/MocA family protein [Thermomicrobiales bacterium]
MTIRLGIAGVRHGHVQYLFDTAAQRPDLVQIVALAEDDPALREHYAARLDPAAHHYANYHEMIAHEDLDVVGVAAVNNERGRIVCDSLAAGLHVIADKPLCTTLDDLAAIEAAWRRGDRLLSVMLEKRLWSPTLAARDLLAAGELGDLALVWASAPHRLRRATRPAWMFDPTRYGGILNDLAIHDLDLILWLSGAQAGQVQGLAGNRANQDAPGFEDYGQVLLRTADGVLATTEVHWFSSDAAPYHGDYRLLLTGTAGTAEVRWASGEVIVATHRTPPRHAALPPAGSIAEDFFTALATDSEPLLGAPDVLTATRVALLAQTHANDGSWHDWQAVQP